MIISDRSDTLRRLKTRYFFLVLGLGFSFALYGCGGGGSGLSIPPPPPSFAISVTPSAPSIAPGTTSAVQVSVVPRNGFSGAVSVTVSGLPSGLSASPSSFSLQSTPQAVTLTADSSLATGNLFFRSQRHKRKPD